MYYAKIFYAVNSCFFIYRQHFYSPGRAKEEKRVFSKIAEAFKPIPGELGAHNIDEFYQAIVLSDSNDPELVALRSDTNNHVVFPAQLGVYDEKAGGFPIILGRYDHPYLKSSNHNYYFFLENINQFRFFKISKDEIKEKFDIIPFDRKFKVEREMQGIRNLAL